jgi:general secretion pathway protein G
MDRCKSEKPKLYRVEDGHDVACFHADGIGGDDWFAELSRRVDDATTKNSGARERAATRERIAHYTPVSDLLPPTARPTEPPRRRDHATPEAATPRMSLRVRLLLGAFVVALFAIGLTRFERSRTARAQIRDLTQELESRKALTGSYPDELSDLGWRLFPIFEKGRPIDPWGEPLRYHSPGADGRPFDLGSTGPDGVKSADDIGTVPP